MARFRACGERSRVRLFHDASVSSGYTMMDTSAARFVCGGYDQASNPDVCYFRKNTWTRRNSSKHRPSGCRVAWTIRSALGALGVTRPAAPEVSADGCTYSYAIPVDTWGVVTAVRGPKEASAYAVPSLQAFVADQWKQMDVEIEWGYEPGRATLAYDGRIEAYDGRLAQLQALGGEERRGRGSPGRGLGGRREGSGGRNPKSESRRPKEIRIPKSETGSKRRASLTKPLLWNGRSTLRRQELRGGACGFDCFTWAIQDGGGRGLNMPSRRMWRELSLRYGPARAASRSWPLI